MAHHLLSTLNVREVGLGENVLVLAHGLGTDQSAWKRILPYFTRDHRVVLYDLACAGSVNPNHFDFGRYTTLDAFVDDLLSILDALQIERCTFIGHSMSGTIGVLASIRRPELFTKLILIGFSPRSDPYGSSASGKRKRLVFNEDDQSDDLLGKKEKP